MNRKSYFKANWILDSEHSNVANLADEDQFIIDSIEDKILHRKKLTDEAKTALESDEEESFKEIPKINRLPFFNYYSYFKKSQNWIGFVEEITQDEFRAKLIDESSPETYEVASFDKEEVSPNDRDFLKPGAVFYWSVGFENNNGQISKKSLIRFKRSVDFTRDDVDEIADQSSELMNSIIWD